MSAIVKRRLLFLIACLLAFTAGAAAQDQSGLDEDRFAEAAKSVQQRLEESISELNRIREQAAEETIPLSRQLRELEGELVDVRTEYQQTARILDSRTLDLANLRNEIKTREQEATYLSNLLGEYVRNFESRLHIAEIHRFEADLEKAKLAAENPALSEGEVYAAQAGLLTVSLDRLMDALGGSRFDGTAVNEGGMVEAGKFAVVGPSALFLSNNGETVGTAEQRLGSLEPTVFGFNDPADTIAAASFIREGQGEFPLDPTLGNAHKIEETEETLLEHIKKGGPVMVPIFALAGIALLLALFKWLTMILVRKPSRRQLNALLRGVAQHDDQTIKRVTEAMTKPHFGMDLGTGAVFGAIVGALAHWLLSFDAAASIAQSVAFAGSQWMLIAGCAALGAVVVYGLRRLSDHSPVGHMLELGLHHRTEPSELIEEIMYEKILATRLKLDSFLPFIAISAAAAPLLGLLGTVTGIINTFQLITVFGSGDVKTLSGGISEALVTTEFGLIVAIPSLLIHALLSRKARGIVNEMEKAGVALVNQISKHPFKDSGEQDGVAALGPKQDPESESPEADGSSDDRSRNGSMEEPETNKDQEEVPVV